MTRPRGFSSGDFDPAYALDEKFRTMAAAVDRRTYLAAEGLWWELISAAWRDAQRGAIEKVIPDSPPDLVAVLRSARLIDHQGRLPRRGFDRWIGAALARRQSETDRKARQRAEQIREIPDSRGNERQPPVHLSRGTPPESLQDRYRGESDHVVRSNGREKHDVAREGNGIDVEAWGTLALEVERLTGKPAAIRDPYGGLGVMARDLVADFGLDRTLAAFQRVAARADHPDASVIVLGANRLLRPLKSQRDLDRAEEAEQSQKRAAAARARTAELVRERDAWIADSTSPPRQAYDGPRRIGEITTPQVRGPRT